MTDAKPDHLGVLDGMRGLMAFWVFYGHARMDVVGSFPSWGSHAGAVDVFMFLSGFLMTYHWRLRQKRFASSQAQTLDFYVRRIFRIAPLYYLLLFVALVVQAPLLEMSDRIAAQVPTPFAAQQAAFNSPTDTTITVASVLAHLTFLFGFVPRFAANNVLPDWSIGLEMQFYLFLPLLLIALTKAGPLSLAIGSLVAVKVVDKLFGLYLTDGPLGNFPQPTLILFKLNVFVAGLCIASAYLTRHDTKCVPWLIAGALALTGLTPIVLACIAGMTFLLFLDGGGTQREYVHRVLSGRVARFFGDTSYAVYLSHQLLLIPGAYFLLRQDWFVALGGAQKVLVVLVVVGVPVYGLSYVVHRLVELPGITLGRRVLETVRQRRPEHGANAA